MQNMSFLEYLRWSAQAAKNDVETTGVRIAIYRSDGQVESEDFQYGGFGGGVQSDQFNLIKTIGHGAWTGDFKFPIQVTVLDIIQNGRTHQGSPWLEPQEVDKWIQDQR